MIAVLAAAGVFLVAPAAGAAELDHKRLAKQVGTTIAPSYPDLPVTAVTCPKQIARKAGTAVICDVTAGTAPPCA